MPNEPAKNPYFATSAEQLVTITPLTAFAALIAKRNADKPWKFDWADDADAITEKGGFALLSKLCLATDLNYKTDKHEGRYPAVKDAYTCPIGKLVNGEPTVFKSGVIAASSRLPTADLSPAAMKAAYRKLNAYRKAFDLEPLAPPAKKKAAAARLALAAPAGLPDVQRVQYLPAPDPMPRTIWVRYFDLSSGQEFVQKLYKLSQEDPDGDILVVISSYGGAIDGLLTMIDAIEAVPNAVSTIAVGAAMSCGAVLLSCGARGQRYALPNAAVMIHEASGFAWGSIADAKTDLHRLETLNAKVMGILCANCSPDPANPISQEDFFDALRETVNTGIDGQRDFFLDAAQAVEIGVIDGIVTNLLGVVPGGEDEDEEDEEEEASAAPGVAE